MNKIKPRLKSYLTLHKYYIYSNRMNYHFDLLIKDKIINNISVSNDIFTDELIYMSYWYSSLYVVIEGWRELNLKDDRIDTLLKSSNLDYLKRFRNGVFHFQRDYLDNRLIEFLSSNENPVKWVRELNLAFNEWFIEN